MNPNLSPQFDQSERGSVLHRGLQIQMDAGRSDKFHAAQTPEEKASVVLEHMNSPQGPNYPDDRSGWGSTTGQHWSNDINEARQFSFLTNDASSARVILHADPPAQNHVLGREGQRRMSANMFDEDEVTFRRNAPVRLTGMSFPDPDPERVDRWKTRSKPDTYVPVSARLKAGKSMM